MKKTTRSQRNAQLLAAGALLGKEEPVPRGTRLDKVSARIYSHRALGARAVVRLVPEMLSRGEDIGLSHIGFGKPRIKKAIARRRHQALGFPGWCLVNDPKHAGFALDVMKEFRKEARRARSKPGHAKEGFDAIASRLTRSVPHFLPSFYEEAGRAFLAESNTHYASQCFGKAREAEKIHALKINEQERKQSFIEFALAGAVSIKALTEYAKDLQAAYDPRVAYEHFSELARRRTTGGLAPWASMARDMRKLAKAAKLDAAREDRKLLSGILQTSSIVRAPKQFWSAYAKSLAAMAKKDSSVKHRLLEIRPEPPGDDDKVVVWWLGYLEQAGVLQEYDKETGDGSVPPAGAWLSKMLDLSTSGWRNPGAPDELFAQLRRMAARLKAEAVPVRMVIKSHDELEVDLCDLALELGVAVADPGEDVSVDLSDWARAADDSEERPRDPTLVAADERFSAMLEQAVDSVVGQEQFENAARGKSAFAELRRQWLLKLVDPPAEALAGLNTALERLENSTSVETFVEFAEARPPLAAITVADRLARCLRGGFIGELGWPELEQACAELSPAKNEKLQLHGAFPYLVASDGRKAIVVGPEGRVMEHDLRLPKSATLRYLQYVDGQLLVSYRTKDWSSKGYWSGKPTKVLKLEHQGYYPGGPKGRQLPLAGGGVHLGFGSLRPGDTKIPDFEKLLSDGQNCWKPRYHDGKYSLQEFDPATGEKGRESKPRFLEDFSGAGLVLALVDCDLFPLPEGLTHSPLGLADGLTGWRVRGAEIKVDERDDREQATAELAASCEFERTDGVRFGGSLGPERRRPDALLDRPGGGVLPVDITSYQDWDDLEWTYALWDPEGQMVVSHATNDTAGLGQYNAGAPLALPMNYWHMLRARDQAGSAALREIDDDVAARLLEGALEDVTRAADFADAKTTHDNAVAAVARVLPQITDDGLRRAVAGVAVTGAWLARRHQELVAARDPERPEARGDPAKDERGEKIRDILGYLIGDTYYSSNLFPQVNAVGAVFGGDQEVTVPQGSVTWPRLVGRMGALAFFATSPTLSDEQRGALLALLEIWAQTPFVEQPQNFRYVTCKLKRTQIPFELETKGSWTSWGAGMAGDNYYFLSEIDPDDDQQDGVKVLEYAPGGTFKLLPSAKLEEQVEPLKGPGWATAERLTELVRVVREQGARAFDRESAEALAERTGMSYAEAALLLTGMPRFGTWESNFLPKELRLEMGLKVKEASAAKDALRGLDRAQLRRILDAAMPEDPAALYQPLGQGPDDDGSFVAGLARAWCAELGQRISVDPVVAAQLDSDVGFIAKAAKMVPMLTDPRSAEQLIHDGTWKIGNWGNVNNTNKKDVVFDEDVLASVCVYISYLHSEMPVGHPLAANLGKVHDMALARLRRPRMLFGGGNVHTGNKQKSLALVESIGGKPFKPSGKRKKSEYGRDNGALLALPDTYDEGVYLAFRPAKVQDWEELQRLADWHRYNGTNPARIAQLMLEGRFQRLVERMASSPLSEGSWEANPLLSVRDLVPRVIKKLKLSEDAAVLYLQLLALPGPTDRKLQQINDWKPARLRKAGKELQEAKLVLEAKRSRAGRKLFLPGGWDQLGRPNLPLESWKLPLYGVQRDKEGKLKMPLGRILPLAPVHTLFEEAWARLGRGDIPRYEEVK